MDEPYRMIYSILIRKQPDGARSHLFIGGRAYPDTTELWTTHRTCLAAVLINLELFPYFEECRNTVGTVHDVLKWIIMWQIQPQHCCAWNMRCPSSYIISNTEVECWGKATHASLHLKQDETSTTRLEDGLAAMMMSNIERKGDNSSID